MISGAIRVVRVNMDRRGRKFGGLGSSARLMQCKQQRDRSECDEQESKTEFDGHHDLFDFVDDPLPSILILPMNPAIMGWLEKKIALLRSEPTDFVNHQNATIRL